MNTTKHIIQGKEYTGTAYVLLQDNFLGEKGDTIIVDWNHWDSDSWVNVDKMIGGSPTGDISGIAKATTILNEMTEKQTTRKAVQRLINRLGNRAASLSLAEIHAIEEILQ